MSVFTLEVDKNFEICSASRPVSFYSSPYNSISFYLSVLQLIFFSSIGIRKTLFFLKRSYYLPFTEQKIFACMIMFSDTLKRLAEGTGSNGQFVTLH